MTQTDELSRLFAAERAVQPPPLAVEQGLARLLPAVAGPVTAVPLAGALKVAWTATSKWVLAGFVVGVAGSGAAAGLSGPAAGAAVAPSLGARVAAPSALSATPPLAVSGRGDSGVQRGCLTRAARSAEQQRRAHAEQRADPLRRRAAVDHVGEGRAGCRSSPPRRAWLAERAARFPRGVFATDAEALSVLLTCAERPDPAAAKRFAAAHPGSPMLDRLWKACRAKEIATPPMKCPPRGNQRAR